MPAGIFDNSMPPGWEPVPYSDSPAGLVTHGGTTLSCKVGGKEVSETWWWVATVPPKAFRDKDVDAYAFLLVGVAMPTARLRGTVRSCLSGWLDQGEISIDEVAPTPRTIHTVTRGEWTDESYLEADQAAALPANRTRMFLSHWPEPGYNENAPLYSFDVIYDAEEGRSGRAAFGQNVNDPYADGSRFAIPGYWTGEGLLFEGNAYITTGGPAACEP